MITGKAWGKTSKIVSNPAFELHRILVKKGGKCSRHRHLTKFNGFLILSGLLAINVWKDDQNLVDRTLLGPGEYTEVKPPEYHQFEALEDSEALEIYWSQFDPNDIERDLEGGR